MSVLTPEQRRLYDSAKMIGQAEGLVEAANWAVEASKSLQAIKEPQAASALALFSKTLGEEAKKRSELALEKVKNVV